MKFSIKFLLCFTLMVFLFAHCARDAAENAEVICDETITYNKDIKSILDGSCAYATDCHASGGQPPDYTTYDNSKGSLDANDFFETRVLIQGDMPPAGSVPLDSTDLYLLRCWKQQGFLEEI